MRISLEWLKEFVDIRMKPERLAHVLTMGGLEVESIERMGKDTIFDIAITPNRGDCLSVVGIAREIAALTGQRMKPPIYKAPHGSGRVASVIRIRIKHSSRCPRYTARAIDGVRIGPSPVWMVERLAASGIRSINNVVDSTNYVMLETGQPLHAFDLKSIRGGRITVQMGGEEAPFKTLDGMERRLAPHDLLICDGEGPVAIAGVMGGEDSEVRESTTSLILESAFFEPTGIRQTSKRLGLSSESSRRFERGVDPNGALAALHRLTEVILKTAGGIPTADWIDIYPKKIVPTRISLNEGLAQRILGISLGVAKMARLLKPLGIDVRTGNSGRLIATVPTFRRDIERPVDLVEEVARLHGYDMIPESMPTVTVSPLSRPRFMDEEEKVHQALIGIGFSEAVLYGFTSESNLEPFIELKGGGVKVTNPLSSDQRVMITTLLPGLLDAARLNIARQRLDLRLFALQKVFHRSIAAGSPEELRHIGGIIMGRRYPDAWKRSSEMLDFYDAKGTVETILSSFSLLHTTVFQCGDAYGFLHPGVFAYIVCGGTRVGFVGQIHPDVAARWELEQEVFVFELDFEALARLSVGQVVSFSNYSCLPFVERDIAIVVGEDTLAVEVEKAIRDCGVELVSSVRIFDVYRGEGIPVGKKSLAITLKFARDDRTLTDEEVKAAQTRVLAGLGTTLGAELRT